MRKLTNRANLPQAIVDAIRNDPYSKGSADISVSELIDSPRVVILTKKHEDEIVEDASDRIWSLFGQAVHTILERANRKAVAERRLSMPVEGWVISGGMDVYEEEEGFLRDYKTTSVWSLVYGDRGKWEKQLNTYAVILRYHKISVKRIQAIALLRDWSKNKAAEDITYPQSQVVNIDLPLWPADIAEQYVRERVILHQQARLSLPQCTPDDKWTRASTWAVMKRGKKRAENGGVYPTEAGAIAHVGFDKSLYVQHRPGIDVRCPSYCAVAKLCTQYQSSLALSARPAEEASTITQAELVGE